MNTTVLRNSHSEYIKINGKEDIQIFEDYHPLDENAAKKAFAVINGTEEWYGIKDISVETLKTLLRALADPEGYKCSVDQIFIGKQKLLRLIVSTPKSVLGDVFNKNNEITGLFLNCFFIEIVQSLTYIDLTINEKYLMNHLYQKKLDNSTDEQFHSCANNAIFENEINNANIEAYISSSEVEALNSDISEEEITDVLLNNDTNNAISEKEINDPIFESAGKLQTLKEHIIISTIAVVNFDALQEAPKSHVELIRGLIFRSLDIEMRSIPEYNELYKLILNTIDYTDEYPHEDQNEEWIVL